MNARLTRPCGIIMQVQKHPKLMIEAKILEDSIKQKQQIRKEEARIVRIVRRDQGKFSTLLDRGHEALSEHDVNVARIDARKAEAHNLFL